jgi:site-specific DNA-adenine methylase
MVTYQGGKSRLGKRIYQRILDIEKEIIGHHNQTYFEPFVGMCGVLRHSYGRPSRREACDLNEDVILMWKASQQGWTPPLECSREYFNELKESKVPSPERGFVGSVASWGSDFFQYYRKHLSSYKSNWNDFKQITISLSNVIFYNASSYISFSPINMTIYCDPPYRNNNLKNKLFCEFDHQQFWEVMREWSKNNLVIVSELEAPDDFTEVWSSNYSVTHKERVKKYQEKLFIHNSYGL